MMRLQAKRADVNTADALGDMASRIQVMAQVYDHLTIRAELKVVDAKQYLTEICQYLWASISGMSPVAITARADELYSHSEQAVPIAIILNELVTNSLKYAFPDGRPDHIHVELRTDGEVVLTVSDNGIGVPKRRSEAPDRGFYCCYRSNSVARWTTTIWIRVAASHSECASPASRAQSARLQST
jgi:two-component system, sensor histidine kinase PdtaS